MGATQAPNTGRILDYWLGGDHHFSADAEAATAFSALFDGFPEVFATLRRFIGRAARAAAEEGVAQFLVLGSGIPAQGNVHEAVPGARVLYTDIDPANIELGKAILRNTPDTDYTYCDAADLGSLDRRVAAMTLDLSERLAIVMVGVSVFLDDDTVRKTLADCYDLAPEGSVLVADFDGEALESHPEVLRILDEGGEPLHLRRPERIRALLGPWALSDDGIRPVDAWRATPAGAGPTFMYGCMARK
ncbi:SAM-dependent methyltransferase [Pendulispora albinea]|uniref:SAM-dependent methyltransferase n=1 Tax=Pendulispora albinea TaxID=2741071 RepID=A0ABZ2LPH0_9BACT